MKALPFQIGKNVGGQKGKWKETQKDKLDGFTA